MKHRLGSSVYNLGILPEEMTCAPTALQISYLDKVCHAADVDIENFVDNFSIQQAEHDCDLI